MPLENQAAATILIADDHALSSEGLQRMLEREGFRVLDPVSDGLAAVTLARAETPDLAILDYDMPGATGLEVMTEIRRWSPETKVAILTGRSAPSLMSSLKDAGADGLFLKSAPPEELCCGIRAILAGETVFPERKEALSLSPREIQTLEAIAAGKTNAAIAEALGISIKTVDSHRTSLMRKLSVHSTASLIVCAVREGLIDP